MVYADLRDFFGSVDYQLLMSLGTRRIADGRVLRLIEQMLKALVLVWSHRCSLTSYLTPFDREMRVRKYRMTRMPTIG